MEAADGYAGKLYVMDRGISPEFPEKTEAGVGLGASGTFVIQPVDAMASAVIVPGEIRAPVTAAGSFAALV